MPRRATRVVLFLLIVIAIVLIVEVVGNGTLFGRSFLRNLLRHLF